MRTGPIPHGFRHAPDWSTAELGCADCGYHELWEDLRGAMNERAWWYFGLSGRAKATRQRIEADMRARLHARGCTHV